VPVSSLLSFAALAGMLTLVPGLDTAMVLRWAIAHGRRPALACALGINAGVWIWGAAASVGIAGILAASELAFSVLQLAGAAYLVWLGTTLLVKAWRRPASGEGSIGLPGGRADPGGGSGRAWVRGLTTNLLNPKVGIFYMAVLPEFIPVHSPHLVLGLLLATIHNLEGLVWFTVLIVGVHAMRRWLASTRIQRAIDAATGCAMIGFGATLALARR
jgi:threonine/homoserine/homoserine lactone efflux protein